jgi:hypothetical protein
MAGFLIKAPESRPQPPQEGLLFPDRQIPVTPVERIIALLEADKRFAGANPAFKENMASAIAQCAESLAENLLFQQKCAARAQITASLRNILRALQALSEQLETGRPANRQWAKLAQVFQAAPYEASLAIHDAAASADALEIGAQRLDELFKQIEAPLPNAAPDVLMPNIQQMAHWVALAYEARVAVPREHETPTAPSRTFALMCLRAVQEQTGKPPKLSRASDVEAKPGEARGPNIRFLEACFAEVRAGLSKRAGYEAVASHPSLKPGRETLAEWIREAQGNSRRRRAPRRKE